MIPLEIYLQEIRSIPRLSLEEEILLFQKAKEGDKEAEWEIIRAHLRFVVFIAKKWAFALHCSLQDLIQVGNMAMMRAAKKHDISRGTRFSTYAKYWIEGALKTALSRKKEVLYTNNISLDAFLRGREENLYAVLSDEDSPSPEKKTERKLLKEVLENELKSLRQRERHILEQLFGLEDGVTKTLDKVGKSLGVTRERVRQIKAKAFEKLRRKKGIKRLAAEAEGDKNETIE